MKALDVKSFRTLILWPPPCAHPLLDSLVHVYVFPALLREKGGCISGDPRLEEVYRTMNAERQAKQKIAREPRIQHMVRNSQEANVFRNVGKTLAIAIPEQRAIIEPSVQRLMWAIRGLATRLVANQGKIPKGTSFYKAAEHVLKLSSDMRAAVFASRAVFNNEVNDESTLDCVIWKKASIAYKKEATDLDHHLRGLLFLTKAARRLVKHIVTVCKRWVHVCTGRAS